MGRFSSLSRSLWTAAHRSGASAAPLSLVSSANLLRVHPIPLSYVIDEAIKQYCSQEGPLRDTLVPSLRPHTELFTTAVRMALSSQFLIHQAVHASDPHFSN